MKFKTLTPLLTAAGLVLAVAGTGCSTTAGMPNAANQDRNFLGIVKIEPNSYSETSPSTLELRTNDVVSKPDISGTKVSLLFGLITIEDY